MEEDFSKMSDKQIADEFEGHKCEQENCELCMEYMRRFDPDRLVELGIDEPKEVNDV